MTIARESLRWNGWGRLGESLAFSTSHEAALLAALEARFGRRLAPPPSPVDLSEVRLPPAKLSAETVAALRRACGDAAVRGSAFERVTHALGRSFPDLLRLRAGDIETAPDAVVYPPDEGAVAAVLRIARDAGLAVVPFGGGTSVVGGVEPRPAPGQSGVLSLDTTRMDALVRIDEASHTATFQAGVDGPALEQALAARGYTLGHFPQSFEHSTLGGWLAARSSGQESNGYGGIDRLLVAVRIVTTEGVLRTLAVPRSAAGPDLSELVMGSEGTLGVIVEATLRVSPRPAHALARGMLFHAFEDGVDSVRDAVREGVGVSMLRLSDATETELAQTLRRDPGRRVDPSEWVLRGVRRLGYGPGAAALVYLGRGDRRGALERRLARVRAVGRRHGGLPLGGGPGRSWLRDRFRTPYLRDWLLDRGVAVDTLETAIPWSRVLGAHEAILRAGRAALEAHAGGGVAMAHLSHSYRDGACLYFTLLYPLEPASPVTQWQAIKDAVTGAVVETGGTLSHHHGVGSDHAPWMAGEKGALGLRALRALKAEMDPAGIMNPGKLW